MDILRDLEKDLGFEDELAVEASRVRIHVEARRYGKDVTVLEGFDASLDLDLLARDLKKGLGTGGTVKNRTVELQGDHRKSAAEWLKAKGYKLA